MNFNPPKVIFQPFDFKILVEKLDKNIDKLKSTNNKKPISYNKDIEKFKNFFLDKKKACLLSKIELRSITIHLLETKKSLEELFNYGLIDTFLLELYKSNNISNKRRLIELSFQYSQFFKKNKINLFNIVHHMLKNFNGKNMFLNGCKQDLKYLYEIKTMLKVYETKENIIRKFNLSLEGEYYQELLVTSLMKELYLLRNGENNLEFFENIRKYKNFIYDEKLFVGEYIVKEFIKRMMLNQSKYDFSYWITFIIELLGDPRTISNATTLTIPWKRVGEEYKKFFIKMLSKEDLELFLESLSNPSHDDIYQYRKKFWKPFSKYVQNIKIFICKEDYNNLDDKFKQRFNGKNSSYSRMKSGDKSFIYIDLGDVKIIEGTHSASVRLYNEVPINLKEFIFRYEQFKLPKNRSILDVFTHQGSEKGSWQSKVLTKIKKYKKLDINLKDTL